MEECCPRQASAHNHYHSVLFPSHAPALFEHLSTSDVAMERVMKHRALLPEPNVVLCNGLMCPSTPHKAPLSNKACLCSSEKWLCLLQSKHNQIINTGRGGQGGWMAQQNIFPFFKHGSNITITVCLLHIMHMMYST